MDIIQSYFHAVFSNQCYIFSIYSQFVIFNITETVRILKIYFLPSKNFNIDYTAKKLKQILKPLNNIYENLIPSTFFER